MQRIEKQTLESFKLDDAVLDQETSDWFKETYNIDLLNVSPSETIVLVNFFKHGASAAIMDLIARESTNKPRNLTIEVSQPEIERVLEPEL